MTTMEISKNLLPDGRCFWSNRICRGFALAYTAVTRPIIILVLLKSRTTQQGVAYFSV